MKTARMVLLVTPNEKARINSEASKLGISASEFVRKTAATLGADDLAALAELETLAPSFLEAVDNIERNLDRAIRTLDDGAALRAHYESEEYRTQVRDELLNDPNIDWETARSVFSHRKAA